MSDPRHTFLTDTTLTKLSQANDFQSLVLGMTMVIHKSRGIAEVKARKFLLTSGGNRSILHDYELEEFESTGEANKLAPEQETKLSLSTDSDYIILSNYINTAEENPAKSIVVKLMSAGILYEILPYLTIKREDILFKINQYYDSIIPALNKEYSQFLFKYPKLQDGLASRADLYNVKRVAFFTDLFKKTFMKQHGREPSENEVKAFSIELGELKARLKNLYEPKLKTILNVFGLVEQTYFRNLQRAQNEIGAQLTKK